MFQWPPSDHAALVTHVYLLGGDVLATIAVGIGILWEAEAITVSHKRAGRLVLWGVVLETVCSIALFSFDEGISHTQQSTIDAQQEKIITLDARLIEVAPRGDSLRGKNRDDLVAVLRPFGAQKVETHFCRQPFPVFDDEAIETAMIVASAMREATWQSPYPTAVQGCGGAGMMVFVSSQASARTQEAANVLQSALTRAFRNVGRANNVESLGQPPPKDPEAIVVLVLSHPL
jgi:hypothetical protein